MRDSPTSPLTGEVVEAPWLPAWFRRPGRLEMSTGHHLRPVRAADAGLGAAAVTGSRERLRAVFGPVWDWPPATVTPEWAGHDLAHVEAEMARQTSFRYGLFDDEERELLGCAHLHPARKAGADVDVSWWVVDRLAGSPVEAALEAALVTWVSRHWPFTRPRFVGRDLTWDEWLALPDRR